MQEVTDEEARAFATVSTLVQADSVERAKRVLSNEKKHGRCERVAAALFALAAVAAPEEEVAAASAACAAVLARKQKPVKVTWRLAARAVSELTTRCCISGTQRVAEHAHCPPKPHH